MQTAKELRRIRRECKLQTEEIIKEMYAQYDAIWWNRIRITDALHDYGTGTIRDINTLMPNLLTYSEFVSPIDEAADMFGFEDANALIDFLLSYVPRCRVRAEIFDGLMSQYVEASNDSADDVPF